MQFAYRSILAFFLTPLLLSSLFAVDLVPWHSDLEQAFRIAKQENRPLLLHFWRTNCAACEHLESAVFNRQEVATALGSYYVPVKINSTQYPSIAAKYRVSRFPTDVILTPNKEEIHRMITVPNAPQYVSQISAVFFRSGIIPKKEPRAVANQSIGNSSYANAYHARQDAANGGINPHAADYARERQAAQVAADRNSQTVANSRPRPTQQEVMNPYAQGATQTGYAAEDDRNGRYIENTTIAENRNRQGDIAPYPPQQRRDSLVQNRPEDYNAQRPVGQAAQRPAGRTATEKHPPIALDGYCPVALLQNEVWKKGDPSWGVVHRGRTYLFSSKQNKDLFFARPDHFSPVLAGIDPVELTDQGKTIEGKRAHGVVYKKRVYLFANEQNLERFWKTPDVFANQIMQAMVTDARKYR